MTLKLKKETLNKLSQTETEELQGGTLYTELGKSAYCYSYDCNKPTNNCPTKNCNASRKCGGSYLFCW